MKFKYQPTEEKTKDTKCFTVTAKEIYIGLPQSQWRMNLLSIKQKYEDCTYKLSSPTVPFWDIGDMMILFGVKERK